VRRANARNHVALSGGGHYCLGAALARVEGTVAFSDLARRFPALHLAGRPRRRPTDLMRGYEHVWVAA
jgi:cytochrome P450